MFLPPQTKFVKVMFLQVCVCPHGGVVVVVGGGCAWRGGGTCVAGGHVWIGVHGSWGVHAMHACPPPPADTMAMAYGQ